MAERNTSSGSGAVWVERGSLWGELRSGCGQKERDGGGSASSGEDGTEQELIEMRDARSPGSRACGQDPDWKMEADEEGEAVSDSGKPRLRCGEGCVGVGGISLKVQQ